MALTKEDIKELKAVFSPKPKKELTEEQKAEKAEKARLKSKGRLFTFILYCDENAEHNSIYEYLKSNNLEKINAIRIFHFGEPYENKNKVEISMENVCNGKLSRSEWYSYCLKVGKKRVRNGKCYEKDHYHFILEYPNCHSIKSVSDNFGLSGSLVSIISDRKQYFLYCMHLTYASMGKRTYKLSDWEILGNNSTDLFRTCTYDNTDNTSNMEKVETLFLENECADSHELLQNILFKGDKELLEFVLKNPYFVKTYICTDKTNLKLKDENARLSRVCEKLVEEINDANKLNEMLSFEKII
ncbi:MAG: replication protein [bacterium]|nr:replication protein [bacterium]